MARWMILILSATGVLTAVAVATAPETQPAPPKSVAAFELGRTVQVIGQLGEPLGNVLVIEGKSVPLSERHDYWSVNVAENLFAVETVNGKQLPHPAWIELRLAKGETLPADKHSTFEGYQDGGFVNVPDGVMQIWAKRGYLRQQSDWHFHVVFHVIPRE